MVGFAGAAAAASTHAKIQSRPDAMERAANVHDTDGFLRPFAHGPEPVFVVNGRVIHGWDALHAARSKWWHQGESDVQYTQNGPTSFLDLASDMVVTTQELGSRRTGAGGKVQTGTFAVTNLWKRQGDDWWIVYAHESWSR